VHPSLPNERNEEGSIRAVKMGRAIGPAIVLSGPGLTKFIFALLGRAT
jgi:hypothetical protein